MACIQIITTHFELAACIKLTHHAGTVMSSVPSTADRCTYVDVRRDARIDVHIDVHIDARIDARIDVRRDVHRDVRRDARRDARIDISPQILPGLARQFQGLYVD